MKHQMDASAIDIELLGDAGLLLRWPQRIDAATVELVQRLAASLRAAPLLGVVDVVPSYASLALLFDARWLAGRAEGDDPAAPIAEALRQRLLQQDALPQLEPREVTLPVCYGGEYGPDLAEVAARTGLSADEVVARHTAARYRVALLGFQPGFPYLLGLDEKLAVPRRDTPRVRVPAGSVAIGGAQTGVYPRDTPGGWQLVGRTAAVLFDETRSPPALLSPGDIVRFQAVPELPR
jgi:KipI family sensor histidine kinase inhibitor